MSGSADRGQPQPDWRALIDSLRRTSNAGSASHEGGGTEGGLDRLSRSGPFPFAAHPNVVRASYIDVLPAFEPASEDGRGRRDVLPAFYRDPPELERIDALGKYRWAVEHVLRTLWDIDVPLGYNFPCPLPGHTRDASMFRDPRTDVFKLHCWCHDQFWTLAEVRAAIAYQRTRPLTNIEAAIWYRRLLSEAGLIWPLPVTLPALPDGTSEATDRIIDGFALLVGLRWLTHYGQPLPYTLDFATAWTGESKYAARKAIDTALASEVIVQADELVAGARKTRLFLPGDAALRRDTDTEAGS